MKTKRPQHLFLVGLRLAVLSAAYTSYVNLGVFSTNLEAGFSSVLNVNRKKSSLRSLLKVRFGVLFSPYVV